MGSLQLCFHGVKHSSRLQIFRHLEIVSARHVQLFGKRIEHHHKGLALSGFRTSVAFSTLSKPVFSQHQLGAISQTYLSISNRDYSSTNLSDKNEYLVYMGRIRGMFRAIKIFSLTTSALGILLQPYLWYSLQDFSLMASVPLLTMINIFVFTNPFLIHYLSKRYVNELYFSPTTKDFTASVLTFFARKEKLTFKAADVQVPDAPGLFSMMEVNGRPLFVDERDFTSMEVYKHLMGFDRPLDLRYLSNPTKEKED